MTEPLTAFAAYFLIIWAIISIIFIIRAIIKHWPFVMKGGYEEELHITREDHKLSEDWSQESADQFHEHDKRFKLLKDQSNEQADRMDTHHHQHQDLTQLFLRHEKRLNALDGKSEATEIKQP